MKVFVSNYVTLSPHPPNIWCLVIRSDGRGCSATPIVIHALPPKGTPTPGGSSCVPKRWPLIFFWLPPPAHWHDLPLLFEESCCKSSAVAPQKPNHSLTGFHDGCVDEHSSTAEHIEPANQSAGAIERAISLAAGRGCIIIRIFDWAKITQTYAYKHILNYGSARFFSWKCLRNWVCLLFYHKNSFSKDYYPTITETLFCTPPGSCHSLRRCQGGGYGKLSVGPV